MEKAISEKDLDIKIKILAKQINDAHRGDPTPVVMVCILNGGFMFFSDLVKHIKYPIEVDFIKCSLYEGMDQKVLQMQYDIEVNIQDKTIFIVDDIFDSGTTMKYLKSHFKTRGAKQIESVSAVYKENLDFPDHFFIYKQPEGFNPWYIGYGMDDPKGYSRNLNTIHTL